MTFVPLRTASACAVILALAATATTNAAEPTHDRAPAICRWLAALREPVEQPKEEPAAWTAAYNALRAICPDDRAVLPDLILALDDPIPRVRAIAAEAIGNIGPEARAAASKLRKLLPQSADPEEMDEEVVLAVITALGQLGDEAVDADDDDSLDAADNLVFYLRSPVFLRAQESLLRLGRGAVPAIAHGLKSPVPNIREGCLSLLARLNCPELLDPEAQLALLGDQSESFHQLGCSGWSVRVGRAATDSLFRFGPALAPRLRKALDGEDPVARMRAASILARLKIFDQSVADRLVEALRKADTAYESLEVIQKTNRTGDPHVLTRLQALLKDADFNVRSRAAVALTDFGAVDTSVLKVHVERLNDAQVADESAHELSRFQDQLKPLEHELTELATCSSKNQARWLAAALLARVAPHHPAIVTTLEDVRKRFDSPDQHERRFALQAAFLMGTKGLPTVFEFLKRGEHFGYGLPPKFIEKAVSQEIVKAARDRDWSYVSRLIEFASRNPSADTLLPCLPILIEHLRPSRHSPTDSGSEAAAACIAGCGKYALPSLIRVLKDPNTAEELRFEVVQCLGKIGPAVQEALPVLASQDLLKQLHCPWEIAKAIKSIGPSVECLPVLLASLDDFLACDDAQEAILALKERALADALKMLESKSSAQRKMGVKVLVSLGQKAQGSVSSIIGILQRSHGDDVDLMRVLASLGSAANDATPFVLQRLTFPSVRVRSAACITLARIAGSDPRSTDHAAGALLRATEDAFAEVRAASADALGLLATQDAGARAAIERLRSDHFATVRHAAERAAHTLPDHQPPPAPIWTIYFDPYGPAAGSLLTNE